MSLVPLASRSAGAIASIPSPSSNSIHIGPLQLRAYGLMIALGVVGAVWLAGRRLEATGKPRQWMSAMAMWGVPAGIVGARLYHVITDWRRFFPHRPWGVFAIWEGGLGIWGGIALGVIFGAWKARRLGLKTLPTMDIVAPALALA